MKPDRREFLRHIAAGGAVVTMPVFLQGCGVTPVVVTAEPMPEDPFLDWFRIDRNVIARVMAELTAKGADVAELYFQHRRQSVLRMRNSQIDRSSTDILLGVGMRVMLAESIGFAFTEDLSLDGMLATARLAASSMTGEAVVPGTFVAKAAGRAYVTQIDWSDIAQDRKRPVLQRVDSKARSADPAVKDVTVSWSDTDERILIATLDGHLVYDHRPMTRLSAQVSATRGGESQSGFANIAARADVSWYTDERIDEMTGEAVDRTLRLFDSRRPPSGDMPVMLAAGTSGVLLHEAIGHSLEADFNRDGKSTYADMLDKRIADTSVNIVDQGTVPNERGALNYDDEGNECGRTVLVEKGVLRSYLHDSLSARQYGVPTTGSGRRESYRHAPMPRMSCTFMDDGAYERDELMARMGRGIIAETYTTGRVQLGAGDYTFTIKNGWLVEKGKILMPVRDFNLLGNGPDTLRNITMVANDSRLDKGGWTCGKNGQTVPVSHGMPTVLVSGLAVQTI
ncbi:MAG: TldD/PmbA family protein [Gammaproteobacteria bacterium]|nr:TldD/PmbA family protein [Gammaproteobacteria bacterium]